MELIASINQAVNGVVWGAPMLIMLIGVGLLMTVRSHGLQFRKFGYTMRNTFGKLLHKGQAGEGEITPFQAVSTALAGTLGTGSIAGIATAVTLGGPGTLFWLWMTALIGMATKYSEVLLAVKFRERNQYGDWVGGPMYYIKNGLGRRWKWLAA
ncbi:MAG: alanine:cation symporter family protein, partial [Clostridiales bacterium]|nr:alanine:cation symporter family protein [Clostridiales bacterium]